MKILLTEISVEKSIENRVFPFGNHTFNTTFDKRLNFVH